MTSREGLEASVYGVAPSCRAKYFRMSFVLSWITLCYADNRPRTKIAVFIALISKSVYASITWRKPCVAAGACVANKSYFSVKSGDWPRRAQLVLNFNLSSDRAHIQQKLAAKSFLSLVTVLWADFSKRLRHLRRTS